MCVSRLFTVSVVTDVVGLNCDVLLAGNGSWRCAFFPSHARLLRILRGVSAEPWGAKGKGLFHSWRVTVPPRSPAGASCARLVALPTGHIRHLCWSNRGRNTAGRQGGKLVNKTLDEYYFSDMVGTIIAPPGHGRENWSPERLTRDPTKALQRQSADLSPAFFWTQSLKS